MLRSELQKFGWRRAVWCTLLGVGLLMVAFETLNYVGRIYSLTTIVGLSAPNQPPPPLPSAEAISYVVMTTFLAAVRQFSGLVIAILTVMLISAEYQFGTIRIVLGRGMSRIRLLLAKLSALLIVGLTAFVIIFALNLADLTLVAGLMGRSGAVFGHVPSYFWSDAGAYLLTILYNLVVTMLFAAFMTVISRSLAIGLVAALVYFMVESIVSAILQSVGQATGNKIWLDAPNYFLGTNLSYLATTVLPRHGVLNEPGLLARGGGSSAAPFDATHAIVVTLLYSAVFLGVSLYLTRKRDVLQ
jgi:ABC-type transport system involved in multi-copper enzyme maturation permease subunit